MLGLLRQKTIAHNARLPLFAFCATLFISVAYTSVDFWLVPSRGWADGLELLAQWIFITLGAFPWLYLLACQWRVFALGYPIVCVLSALLAFFRYTTGSVLTTMLLDATLGSGVEVIWDFISWQLILWLVFALAISLLFARWRYCLLPRGASLFHLLIALGLLLLMYNIPRLQRPMTERIPLNLVFVPIKYYTERRVINQVRPAHIGKVHCTAKGEKPLVILVLGESLRADHLSLNGYERETTPQLAREDVVSLSNVYSPYTYTNPSIPHLLTRADSLSPERADAEPSFIPLFSRAGYRTAWFANQEPTTSYAYFMNECDTLVYAHIDKSYYVFERWTDDVLLEHLQTWLGKEPEPNGGLAILHTMGSHWYYDAHYTEAFERYRPTTKSRILRANSREEMINSYDNTILFTDDWLSRLIGLLKDREAIMIYQSDHGEALGEGGVWLHASDSPPAHRPAGLVWMSQAYKAKYPRLHASLLANRDRYYHTDYLFHTVLEAGRVEAPQWDKTQSLFYSD